MVTKRRITRDTRHHSLILAKNHMVTKPLTSGYIFPYCLILAKNHMVTKHRIGKVFPL